MGPKEDVVKAQQLKEANQNLQKIEELYQNGKLRDILPIATKVSKIYKNWEIWESYIKAQIWEAQILMMLSNPEKGYSILQKVLKVSFEYQGKISGETAQIYEMMGYYFGLNNRFNDAISIFQKKLQIELQLFGEKYEGVASTYYHLGCCYRDQGYFSLAIKYMHKSLNIIKILSKKVGSEGIATIYNSLGIVYLQKMDYDKTIFYCSKALNIRKKLLGHFNPFVADSLHYIGQAYMKKGDPSLGILYFQKVLQIRLKAYGVEHRLCATAYSNLGVCYSAINDTDSAITHLNKALAIQQKVFKEKHSVIAFTYIHIAQEYEKAKSFEKAIEFYQKALEININSLGETSLESAASQLFLGKCLSKMKKQELALQYLHKSLDIKTKLLGEKNENVLEIYNLIGHHHLSFAGYKKALQYYQKAIDIHHHMELEKGSLKIPPIQSRKSKEWLYALIGKATCLFYLAHFQNTITPAGYLKTALESFEMAHESMIKIQRSYQSYQSKLNLGEKNQNLYQGGIQTALALNLSKKAFQFCEQSKANLLLTSMQENLAKSSSNIPQELLQKEKNLKIELTHLDKIIQQEEAKDAQKNEKILREFQIQFFDYHQEYRQLIESFEQNYPKYYQLKYETQTTSIEEIQKSLSNNQVMVNYFVGDTHYYIFLITPDLFEVLAYQKPNDFEELVETFLKAIQQHELDIYCQTAFRLHRMLMKEVEAFLIDPFAESNILKKEKSSPTNNKRLIIIPHGILNYIPFEALLCTNSTSIIENSNTGNNPYHHLDYLLLHCEISYHYSATLWHYLLEKQGNQAVIENSFVGFAPVYQSEKAEIRETFTEVAKEVGQWATRSEALEQNNTWASLPYSKVETKSIAQLFDEKGFKSQTFLYEDATKEQFQIAAEKSRFLLIAAHGVVNDKHPKLSGLVFYPKKREKENGRRDNLNDNSSPTSRFSLSTPQIDCILSMEETYHLNLKADLVVLSSCESGVGQLAKGEGMMAVNRGFLFAGAKNVVSTLFKVYDQPSSLLTQHLFEEILKDLHQNCSYAQALRIAKLKLVKSKKADVKSWSGFVLIGG